MADRIVVIDVGRVRAVGPHTELLGTDPYAPSWPPPSSSSRPAEHRPGVVTLQHADPGQGITARRFAKRVSSLQGPRGTSLISCPAGARSVVKVRAGPMAIILIGLGSRCRSSGRRAAAPRPGPGHSSGLTPYRRSLGRPRARASGRWRTDTVSRHYPFGELRPGWRR